MLTNSTLFYLQVRPAIKEKFPIRLDKVVLFFFYCWNDFLSFSNFCFENCLTVTTDWDAENVHSRLAGSMTYKQGQLTMPTAGPYYIYAQLYFHTKGMVEIRKNNKKVTMLQPAEGTDHLPFYTEDCDVISLNSKDNVMIYMSSAHTCFGAFLI